MSKEIIGKLSDGMIIYRCNETKISWIGDPIKKIVLSHHPRLTYDEYNGINGTYGIDKKYRLIKCHGFYYNIDICYHSNWYELISLQHCNCEGNHFLTQNNQGAKL